MLTGSSFAVGLIGVVQAIPLLVLSLFGGVIADAVDRRRLLLITQVGLAAVSLALALATQLGSASVPLLYVLTAAGACFSALDNPTRASLAPTLVDRRLIRAAMALNQTIYQFALVFGSALAGFIIARLGLAGAYWLDAASFAAAFVAVWLMRTPPRVATERQPVLEALVEGVRYLGATRILLATMSLDFLATFFGSPRALFPYYADRVFHVGRRASVSCTPRWAPARSSHRSHRVGPRRSGARASPSSSPCRCGGWPSRSSVCSTSARSGSRSFCLRSPMAPTR